MLRTLFGLALPGGRRVFLVYRPADPIRADRVEKRPAKPEPHFDRGVAQLGVYIPLQADEGMPKALKTKR